MKLLIIIMIAISSPALAWNEDIMRPVNAPQPYPYPGPMEPVRR